MESIRENSTETELSIRNDSDNVADDTGAWNTEQIILNVLNILIGSCGILGNGIVIIVICTNLKSFKSLTHLLILHQSVIDFASSLVFTVLRVDRWKPLLDIPGTPGEMFCRLWYSEYPLWALFMTSTLNLVLLSTERYLAVIHPVFHRNKLSRTKTKIAMTVIWVVGFTYQSYLAATNTRVDGACVWGWKDGTESLQTFVGILTFFAEYFCPMCVICVEYLCIALKLRGLDRKRGNRRGTAGGHIAGRDNATTGSNNIPLGPPPGEGTEVAAELRGREIQRNKDFAKAQHFSRAFRNVIKTLLVVFLLNIFCWTPTEFEYMIYNLGGYINFDGTFHKISVVLVVCNMLCNPFVYSIQYKEFQKGFRKTFRLTGPHGNSVDSTVATAASVTDNC